MLTTLGERIARCRRAAGLTGYELGELAGLSHSIVRMIESGERPNPQATTVSAIARVMGVSLDWLVTGTGDGPSDTDIAAAVERARAEKAAKAPAPSETAPTPPSGANAA